MRGPGLARGRGEERPGGGRHRGLPRVLHGGGLGGHQAHAVGWEPETATFLHFSERRIRVVSGGGKYGKTEDRTLGVTCKARTDLRSRDMFDT